MAAESLKESIIDAAVSSFVSPTSTVANLAKEYFKPKEIPQNSLKLYEDPGSIESTIKLVDNVGDNVVADKELIDMDNLALSNPTKYLATYNSPREWIADQAEARAAQMISQGMIEGGAPEAGFFGSISFGAGEALRRTEHLVEDFAGYTLGAVGTLDDAFFPNAGESEATRAYKNYEKVAASRNRSRAELVGTHNVNPEVYNISSVIFEAARDMATAGLVGKIAGAGAASSALSGGVFPRAIRAAEQAAKKASSRAITGFVAGETFMQTAGDRATQDVQKYMDMTGDYELKYYDPSVDLALNTGVSALSSVLEASFGIEKLVPDLLFGKGVKGKLATELVKTFAGEGGTEFLQNLAEQGGDILAGYAKSIDWGQAFHDGLVGGGVGLLFGTMTAAPLYYLNRRRMIRQFEGIGFTKEAATQITDNIFRNVSNNALNNLSASVELKEQNGQAWDKLVKGVKTAMETVGFGDEQSRNSQAITWAKTNSNIAISQALKSGLTIDEWLDIAEFSVMNNGQNLNMVFVKPLGSVADIDARIKGLDDTIARERELKKTGAGDNKIISDAKRQKAILQKAKAIKQFNEAQYQEQIQAQTTPETAQEIETATKDAEIVKNSPTQADFDTKVSENLTSGEKAKRYGNAVLKTILPTKTEFDAVMVDPMYANAKQAIIAVADRINAFISAHKEYGLKGDIANALRFMQTVNQGNFIDSVSTPDLTGNDVIAENAFLYHFLFSDANTIQAYLNAYITRAEQSLNGEILELSKKDLVGQSLKATDETMQAQAKILGIEYQSIYDESGKTFIDKNVMAVWESGQHKFISGPVQLTLFQQDNLTERENGPKIVPNSKTIKPVEIKNVPKFTKTADLRNWLIGIFDKIKTATIDSTGEHVDFTKEDAKRVVKNSRKQENNLAYKEIKEVVQRAEYSGFRKSDAKHPKVIGQDVYHSAILVDGIPYSVEFYVDQPVDSKSKNNFAGNKISRIEIEPAATQEKPAAQTGSITSISLGVLREKVKPARYKNGVLAQSRVANGSYDPELGVIILGRNMNEMTLPHEMQHYWLDKIFSIYKRAQSGELKVRDEWIAETKALFNMLGIDENQTSLTQGQHEKFARMSEAYLTGMGVGDMNATFKEYQQWVPQKYKSMMNLAYVDDEGKIVMPYLDQAAVDFFNKWYANYSLPSLQTSPERQEFVNPEKSNGEVQQVSIKEMNNRNKEFGNDAEEQIHTDERFYNTLDENMPADIKVEADGQKAVQESRSNFLKESENQQRRWYEHKSRDKEAQLAQDYIEKNPEHAKEVIYGDPELVPNDTGIDRATLINAYMALNKITPESEDWARLHTNIAINQSLAGTQLALSNNTSYRAYLDALREIETARELKAATNYAGVNTGALERFNRDIQRFVDEELPKVLATEANSEARTVALKSLFEKARTKFSGNTTGSVLNQMDIDYAKAQKKGSAAFTRWAINQIKKDAGAKLNGKEQAKLLEISAKAQQATIDLDDRNIGKAVSGAQEIRKWQIEKDKIAGVKPQSWSLFGDWAPRAMLASINTLVVSNIPSTAMNTGVVRILERGVFGKNEVSTSLTESEIKRIKAIYNATAMNLAQMEKPTSPSLLHGEKYSTSGQKWYDPFTILGREDNWFRVPTFVNTLARIATTDAKATNRNPDEVFKEYCRLENQSDEARLARKQALAVANMAVFTQDGSLAKALNGIRDWINKGSRALVGLDPNGFGLGNLLSPFLKTGANIAEMGIRGSLAPITTISAAVQRLRSGKALDPMKKLALGMDWTYFTFSAVMTALLAALTSDDDDFYSEPYEMGKKYDPNKPYDSINIAGFWIDLDFFGPFAIPIRTGCRLIKQWKTDNLSAIYKGYGQGLKYAAMDTPLLESVFNNQMSYASKKPEDWATGYAYNQINKLVPAQAKPVSRVLSRSMGWEKGLGLGKVVDKKFHRNYGFDGAELTTQDLIDIFSTKFTWQPKE